MGGAGGGEGGSVGRSGVYPAQEASLGLASHANRNEDMLGLIILGLDPVFHVVLLEVE